VQVPVDRAYTSALKKIARIVDLMKLNHRSLVKEIVQAMIKRSHLGWLVVVGGVLGGLIGLLVTLAASNSSYLFELFTR